MTTREQIAALYATTEAQRHAAEVRYVATLPSRAHRVAYLLGAGGVAERRGQEAAERIIADLAALSVEVEAAIAEQSRACC